MLISIEYKFAIEVSVSISFLVKQRNVLFKYIEHGIFLHQLLSQMKPGFKVSLYLTENC